MKNKNIWVIKIAGGYGSFFFEGTEMEAEQRRIDKCRWEGSIGKKRLATQEEIEQNKINDCWNHVGFENKFRYKCDCEPCSIRDEKLKRRRELYKLKKLNEKHNPSNQH